MNTIRNKMMLLSILIWIIMAVIWLSMNLFNQRTVEKYNEILQRYLLMNQASEQSQQALTSLNNYRISLSQESLQQYFDDSNKLLHTKSELNWLRNANNAMLLDNFQHMLESQAEAMGLAVRFQKDNNEDEVAKKFDEASNISKYISEATLTLISGEQKTYNAFYRKIIKRSDDLLKMGFWTLALVSLMLLIFSFRFVNSVTQP
ncbi:two-component sensor histidine kinase, partial [Paenibacillus sp. DLE-14]|nr:two-component sensor histidine kinase [Paenibacillus lignilyticus]